MKLNGNNIITDNDITLTGKHSGETLDVILDNQQEEIDKLKGNVKWIYQNGGVGGNGSSGGGGVAGAWSIFATLESAQVKSNNIILNGNGNYNLVVKINNPQGGIFKCNNVAQQVIALSILAASVNGILILICSSRYFAMIML